MGKALSPDQRVLRTISEKVWQKQVRETLTLAGFDLIYCTWNSIHSPKGFPDLVATRETDGFWTLLFVELKRETSEATADQLHWLGDLSMIAALINRMPGLKVRMIVDLWRPSDADRLWNLLQEVNE